MESHAIGRLGRVSPEPGRPSGGQGPAQAPSKAAEIFSLRVEELKAPQKGQKDSINASQVDTGVTTRAGPRNRRAMSCWPNIKDNQNKVGQDNNTNMSTEMKRRDEVHRNKVRVGWWNVGRGHQGWCRGRRTAAPARNRLRDSVMLGNETGYFLAPQLYGQSFCKQGEVRRVTEKRTCVFFRPTCGEPTSHGLVRYTVNRIGLEPVNKGRVGLRRSEGLESGKTLDGLERKGEKRSRERSGEKLSVIEENGSMSEDNNNTNAPPLTSLSLIHI